MEKDLILVLTLYISNGGQNTNNKTHMNKINSSVIIKISEKKPATAHTHNR